MKNASSNLVMLLIFLLENISQLLLANEKIFKLDQGFNEKLDNVLPLIFNKEKSAKN
jgi:hypothetical protein